MVVWKLPFSLTPKLQDKIERTFHHQLKSSKPVSRILFPGKPGFLSFIFAIYPSASGGQPSYADVHDLATRKAGSL